MHTQVLPTSRVCIAVNIRYCHDQAGCATGAFDLASKVLERISLPE